MDYFNQQKIDWQTKNDRKNRWTKFQLLKAARCSLVRPFFALMLIAAATAFELDNSAFADGYKPRASAAAKCEAFDARSSRCDGDRCGGRRAVAVEHDAQLGDERVAAVPRSIRPLCDSCSGAAAAARARTRLQSALLSDYAYFAHNFRQRARRPLGLHL